MCCNVSRQVYRGSLVLHCVLQCCCSVLHSRVQQPHLHPESLRRKRRGRAHILSTTHTATHCNTYCNTHCSTHYTHRNILSGVRTGGQCAHLNYNTHCNTSQHLVQQKLPHTPHHTFRRTLGGQGAHLNYPCTRTNYNLHKNE